MIWVCQIILWEKREDYSDHGELQRFTWQEQKELKMEKKRKESYEGKMETSPAFTVITCGVNPIPADPAKRNI